MWRRDATGILRTESDFRPLASPGGVPQKDPPERDRRAPAASMPPSRSLPVHHAIRSADYPARPLRVPPALLGADRGHGRAGGADLAYPVAALRRAGGQSRPVVRRVPRTDRAADPEL